MEINFQHKKTFRYQILNDSPQAKTVLYVLHGYGQLVKFFIRKFQSVDSSILIVAPEGMHRFYLKGNYGRVGASWMTKEARETDIMDNLSYLNSLDEQISKQYPIEKRILLGFSQGGATAARWKMNQSVHFDATIIWGSDFPLDSKNAEYLKKEENNYFVIGDNDEFFDAEKRHLLTEQFLSLGFKTTAYQGGHDIDAKTLNDLLKEIQNSKPFGTVSD
ncbi:MAG TPA: phospholipase [Crocinitomicaceae bacterium]|nr:phospholipase [Crocinitomicaceae bacterium]